MTGQSVKFITRQTAREQSLSVSPARDRVRAKHSMMAAFRSGPTRQERAARTSVILVRTLGPLLCLLSFIAGCKVGPNLRPYHDPLGPWHAFHEADFSMQEDDQQQWWLNFDDAHLHRLIHQVAHENLSLQEAAERIQEARARVGIARSGKFPQLTHQTSVTRIDISDNGNPAGISGFPFPPFDLWSTGFNVAWEVDLFGRVQRITEAACADLRATAEARNALQVSLVGDAAALYVGLRVLDERIEQALENIAIQEQTLAITQGRFAAGAISALDVAQAEAQLNTTRASVPTLQRERELILNRLSILRGEQPRGLLDIADHSGTIPEVSEPIIVGIPHDLVRRRPDVRAAEQQVVAAAARIGVATAELYPSLSLTGVFALDSKNASNLFESESFNMRVGPALRWNILSFGRIWSGIEAAESAYRQAQLRYRQTVLEAVGEVEDAMVSLHHNREIANHLAEAVASARTGVELATKQYEAGAIPFQAVLESQRQLTQITDAWIVARGNIAISAIRLYKALGGGWHSPSARSVTSPSQPL
ncbi:MAG: hypothetical protein KatS3mg111_3557 [Pirellulaceae bacterium]|nr:MAG: hypothetical protein KatS3mg111_3557 [Pirellulaceae bacterium]